MNKQTSADDVTVPVPAVSAPAGATPVASSAAGSVADTGATLSSPKCFCPDGGMVGGKDSQFNERTGALLHGRLRAVGTLYVVVSAFGHARDLFIDVGFSMVFPWIVMATIVLMTGYLWFAKNPPLIKLRFYEVYFFAAPLATLSYLDYMLILQSAQAGLAGVALMNWYRYIIHMAMLIAGYTIFIPAGWKRTLAVSMPMALAPFVTGWIMMGRHPEVAAAAQEALTAEILTGGILMIGIFVAMAAYGTYTIDSMRRQAAEAGFAGQYQLEKKIGTGGMGEVWLGRHNFLARPVAIKLIRPDMLKDGDAAKDANYIDTAMKRFEREAQATASLTSPHTVDLYDFGTARDGSFFYVMQYLDGLDLDSLVDKYGPVPVERAVYLLTQACESLADAHEYCLIHRDIKPSNIFATRQGIAHDFVKVLDFGLVKGTRADTAATRLTQQGVTSGTPAYMPPEIALGRDDVDFRADIYALGCVGYWLTTGQYVFASDTPMEMVVDHVKAEPAAPSTRTEMPIPREFDDIILRSLAKDPKVRFQSMREFAEALQAVPVREPWNGAKAEEWWALRADAGASAA